MFSESDMFGRGAEGAAVTLAIIEPDPLADIKPPNAFTELVDDPGAIAIGDHAGKLHRAIGAGAATDIGGIDSGCVQPDPNFARSGLWRRHLAEGQDVRRRAGSLVPDRFHSVPGKRPHRAECFAR